MTESLCHFYHLCNYSYVDFFFLYKNQVGPTNYVKFE